MTRHKTLLISILGLLLAGLSACPLTRNHPCDKVQCESVCGATERCVCGKCQSTLDFALPDGDGPPPDTVRADMVLVEAGAVEAGPVEAGTTDTTLDQEPVGDGLVDSSVDGAPVQFTVSPETEIVAHADVGGTVSWGSQVYLLVNDSAAAVTYSVSALPSWLVEILPSSSGTIPAQSSVSITVSVIAGYPFTAGNYKSTLTFSGGGNSETRELDLTVYYPGDSAWTRYITIPIIKPSFRWSTEALRAPQLLCIDNGSLAGYHLWYLGKGASGVEEIGYASSIQVHQKWFGELQPVFRTGTLGSWNENLGPFSVIHTGTEFKLWYTASGSASPNPGVGHATSGDGINWNKANGGNAVFEAGGTSDWDAAGIASLSVILDATTYKMWYVSGSSPQQRLGYATSVDGINWTRVSELSDLTYSSIAGLKVLKEGPVYRMWYIVASNALYYASSLDGLAWTPGTQPLMELGSAGAFDSDAISGPAVCRGSPAFMNMIYSGNHNALGYANSSP